MAGNFFQKTLNGEPDTCWCVCVLRTGADLSKPGFLCVYTHAIENHQRQLATHTHIWASALSKPRVRMVASPAAPIACISALACVLAAVHQTTSTRLD